MNPTIKTVLLFDFSVCSPLTLIQPQFPQSCFRWEAEGQISELKTAMDGRISRQAKGILYDVPGEGILGRGDTCGVSLLGAGQRLKEDARMPISSFSSLNLIDESLLTSVQVYSFGRCLVEGSGQLHSRSYRAESGSRVSHHCLFYAQEAEGGEAVPSIAVINRFLLFLPSLVSPHIGWRLADTNIYRCSVVAGSEGRLFSLGELCLRNTLLPVTLFSAKVIQCLSPEVNEPPHFLLFSATPRTPEGAME